MSTVRYDVRHTTTYSYSQSVAVCHNLVHLEPRTLPGQRLLAHAVEIDPQPGLISRHVDFFGNAVRTFSIERAHDRLAVTAVSRVEVDPPADWRGWPLRPWEELRDRLARAADAAAGAARQYTLDSPLVQGAGPLARWAEASFTPGRPWAEALFDLTRRIHREFTYEPGATTTGTPVEEVFALRRGVCQDFAHLQIACLRSLGLAARYVSGYLSNERAADAGSAGPADAGLVGADASHAWLACWGGDDGWLDVDPTNDCTGGTRHLTVAWGRDYGDVSPVKGVCIGGGDHRIEVVVDVRRRP